MKVVNLRKESYTHYIGRGSDFGNPFVIGKDGTREEVIIKYKNWVKEYHCDLQGYLSPLGYAISKLPKDAILGCYCKPKDCHGDIIIKIWKEMHNEVS